MNVADDNRKKKLLSKFTGGETAEMPALFGKDSYDLAGYCVGVVDYVQELPTPNIKDGDILLGLPSNGFHCRFANKHISYFTE